jgi:hypothetical protein
VSEDIDRYVKDPSLLVTLCTVADVIQDMGRQMEGSCCPVISSGMRPLVSLFGRIAPNVSGFK